MTPDELAGELRIDAKRLRGWLRKEYPRGLVEAGQPWALGRTGRCRSKTLPERELLLTTLVAAFTDRVAGFGEGGVAAAWGASWVELPRWDRKASVALSRFQFVSVDGATQDGAPLSGRDLDEALDDGGVGRVGELGLRVGGQRRERCCSTSAWRRRRAGPRRDRRCGSALGPPSARARWWPRARRRGCAGSRRRTRRRRLDRRARTRRGRGRR